MGDNQNTQTTPTGKDGAEVADVKQSARQDELSRIRNITLMAKDYKNHVPKSTDLQKVADQYIQEEKSVEDFRQHILNEIKQAEPTRTPETNTGMYGKDVEDYSIKNIVLYQLGKLPEKEVGLELEAHRHLENKLGKKTKGILVPDEIQKRRRNINLSKLSRRERDLVVGTPASGGYLVQDEYTDYSFIELLENSMIFTKAGVQMLSGLVGDIPMNRELDAYTFYWVGEGSGPTKSSVTFSQETMSPKKGGALGKYSYEFLMQDSIGVEAYIERRLAKACALGLDKAIGYGTGLNNQPTGLKNWTGIGSGTGAGFNRDSALNMEGQLYTANAEDLGAMKWLSRGSLRSTLKGVKIDAGSGNYLVSDQNDMIGYDYNLVSNQVDAGDLMFGIWSQILLAYWNMLEIKASEFDDDAFKAGDVLVRALLGTDVFVLNPAAFSVAESVSP